MKLLPPSSTWKLGTLLPCSLHLGITPPPPRPIYRHYVITTLSSTQTCLPPLEIYPSPPPPQNITHHEWSLLHKGKWSQHDVMLSLKNVPIQSKLWFILIKPLYITISQAIYDTLPNTLFVPLPYKSPCTTPTSSSHQIQEQLPPFPWPLDLANTPCKNFPHTKETNMDQCISFTTTKTCISHPSVKSLVSLMAFNPTTSVTP